MALRDYWGGSVDLKRWVRCLNANDCQYRCGHKVTHHPHIHSCGQICRNHFCVPMKTFKFYEDTAWIDKGMPKDPFPERVQGGFESLAKGQS